MSDIESIQKATSNSAPLEGSTNRGEDIRITSQDGATTKVTLEVINGIVLDYFVNVISPTVTENDAVRPVPVLYGDAERWAMFRRQGFIRDLDNGKLFCPLIMIRRTSIEKGSLRNPNNKYIHRVLDVGWNARNAYDKFTILNNIRPSQKMRTVIVPDYMDLTYEVILWTEQQVQMDHLIEQINVEDQEYWGRRNNYKFRVDIQAFETKNELPADKDRLVRTSFTMQIGAYLLPEKMIDNFKASATNTTFYTPKKIIIQETVVNNLKK